MRITEEQWESIIQRHHLMGHEQIVQGLVTAKQFQESMEKIHRLADHAQEEQEAWEQLKRALLAMGEEEEDEGISQSPL